MRKTNELIEMNIRTMERLTDTLNSVVATMIEMKNELIETRRIQNELVERVGSEYYGTAEPPVRCGESHLSRPFQVLCKR